MAKSLGRSLFSKKRNIAFLALGLVAIVASVVLISPKTVTVSIEVDAVNGGVFTQDCKITDYAISQISDQFLAKSKNSETEVKAKVDWFTERGNCSGVVKVSVSPFETFDLYAGNTLIGAIKDGDAWNGKVDGFAAVAVTHDINVTMDLSIIAGSCTGDAESSWSCRGIYGMYTNSDDGTCYGSGSYYDISKNADIVISPKGSEETYEGELDNGTEYFLESTSSKKITCKMPAKGSIEVAHNEDGYYVEIADRGQVFFSNEDLDNRGWVAGVILGG
jgi:hypothetical protein